MANNRPLIFALVILSYVTALEIDKNGYILYCPCMGRFGNQADHFLGVLAFSKGLDRTLVLPPWVEYQYGRPTSIQVPFKNYFQVSPLEEYHRVMTMEDFMQDIAPAVWPEEARTVLCYMPRFGSEDCNAKEGSPFGPFWDTFDVNFVNSSFYRPLTYDVHHGSTVLDWAKNYPPHEWPVLAFTGAPASFPVQKQNRALQEYLVWSDDIDAKAQNVIDSFPRGPFVGIHLRNGVDWERACEHVEQSPNLFAAPQCLGYLNERGRATHELCLPSFSTIVKQIKRAIKKVNASIIFVASDHDHMMDQLTEAFSKLKVKVLHSDGAGPHVDLAVLGRANHFIGNCISSFSAFVVRERDVHGLPYSFWAFPLKKSAKASSLHQEL
ncbi:GDP-fucose protein O-fucosyltransferase 1 [Hyalella azteca]|uniref:GDP-fucose protein O-fucosyltransferase 1 n=1 Tax=Hyalella azteca TaxID=294128 RepID=A0A8B7NGV9_HYAAZ|nr:GDP-fucose protein O-fucosyltransferase 1 [Hyalella azteca]